MNDEEDEPRNSVATQARKLQERAVAKLPEDVKAKLRERKTPPKKYLDKRRTTVSPEWTYWHDKHGEKQDDDPFGHWASVSRAFGIGDAVAEHMSYFPEEYEKDLGDGDWVFVIDVPRTELDARFKVPLLSIWWARPFVVDVGAIHGRYPYQGVINTPGGELHLWPHEYTILKNPEGIIGEEGTELHSLGGDPVIDEELLFYLMSRGIERREATLMLFKHIEDGSAFGYITLHPDLVEIFAGVGTTLSSHISRHPRKVKA